MEKVFITADEKYLASLTVYAKLVEPDEGDPFYLLYNEPTFTSQPTIKELHDAFEKNLLVIKLALSEDPGEENFIIIKAVSGAYSASPSSEEGFDDYVLAGLVEGTAIAFRLLDPTE